MGSRLRSLLIGPFLGHAKSKTRVGTASLSTDIRLAFDWARAERLLLLGVVVEAERLIVVEAERLAMSAESSSSVLGLSPLPEYRETTDSETLRRGTLWSLMLRFESLGWPAREISTFSPLAASKGLFAIWFRAARRGLAQQGFTRLDRGKGPLLTRRLLLTGPPKFLAWLQGFTTLNPSRQRDPVRLRSFRPLEAHELSAA